MRKFIFSMALAAGVLASSTAMAGFQVTFSALGGSTTVVDNVGPDTDLTLGNINVNGLVINGYTFNAALSTAGTSGTGISFVTSGVNSVQGVGAGTISIYASANGFIAPAGSPAGLAKSTATFAVQTPADSDNTAQVSYSSYVDNANALTTAAAGTAVGSGGPVNLVDVSSTSFSATNATAISPLYSLNLLLTAVVGSGGANQNSVDLDGSVQLTPVPEPTSLVVWTMISATALLVRRKRSR